MCICHELLTHYARSDAHRSLEESESHLNFADAATMVMLNSVEIPKVYWRLSRSDLSSKLMVFSIIGSIHAEVLGVVAAAGQAMSCRCAHALSPKADVWGK